MPSGVRQGTKGPEEPTMSTAPATDTRPGNAATDGSAPGSYAALIRRRGMKPYLATQFLGALNDNVFRMTLSLLALGAAMARGESGGVLGLVGAVFILPFVLFSGWAGWLADRVGKRSVLVSVKVLEVGVMGLAVIAFLAGRIEALLAVLFLMAFQSTLFSPAKYGILPEMLPARDLSRANGLLEMSTFLAIVLGTSLGGLLYQALSGEVVWIGAVLLGIAVAGLAASLGIRRVPATAPGTPFPRNPWREILRGGRRILADRTLALGVAGTVWFWFAGALVQMDLILLGKESLGLDDAWVGLLGTALAVGIGIGSLLAGTVSGSRIETGLVPLGALGMALGCGGVALAGGSFAATAAALAFLGLAGGFFVVPLNALVQHRADPERKGQVLATANVAQTGGVLVASGLFALLGGPLGLSAEWILALLGAATLGLTFVVVSLAPGALLRLVLRRAVRTIYRLRVEGAENLPGRGPALLVANHLSYVDGLLLGASVERTVCFFAHASLFRKPVLGPALRRLGAIPIAGGHPKQVAESIALARRELGRGRVVGLFAEGAISRTGNLLRFRRGLERIVQGLDVPVVPVYLGRVWGSVFSFEGGRFFWKRPRRVPYPVTVSLGRPLPAPVRADEVRAAVQELGSDAARLRRSPGDLLHRRFLRTARRRWLALAMTDASGRRLGFGRVAAASLCLARRLGRLEGERLGLMLPASPGGALANVAALLAGKVPVNLNFTAGETSWRSAMEQCGIRSVVTSRRFLEKAGVGAPPGAVYLEDLAEGVGGAEKIVASAAALLLPAGAVERLCRADRAAAEPDTHSPATIVFSSGSTGEPKGVVLSHHAILSNVEGIGQVLGVGRDDRILASLPFFHSLGFTGTIWLPLLRGFAAVYHPNPVEGRVIGRLVQRHHATILLATPTFCRTYVRSCSREQLSSLRRVVVGAEKLHEATARSFRERFGLDLLEGYGCTETAPVVAVNVPDVGRPGHRQTGTKAGSVGHPLPDVSVRIVDPESGAALPAGEDGLVLVKGPNLMLGYWGRPELTREAFRDGWYVTGDLGRLDEDGFLTITDRLSRFGKIAGEMVPLGRVEEAVAELLGGGECAAAAVPDRKKGERLVVLYTSAELSPRKLWRRLRGSALPKLWVPQRESLVPVKAIPTLGTGKVDLRAVRDLALELTRSEAAC
jgi:acyl-[acyl-carrier-protein]-phospholipid O-acyltransferase/long-chain-fatty-acid--[acyl-carrier-protein] ligase